MADNKDIINKREVSRVTLQESYKFANPTKCKSEKRIAEEEKLFHFNSSPKDKTSKLNHTNEGITCKRNLCCERNINKVENYCDICDVVCCGIDNFKLHIEGKKHNKSLKDRKVRQQVGSIYRNIEIPTAINCDVCEKKFSKPETYLQHCKGEIHQEISSLYCLVKTKKLDDTLQLSEDLRCTKSSFTYCDVCKIGFSPMAYDLHIETSEHHRKIRNLKELVVMEDVLITSEEGNRLRCETCGIAFNGPVPYKQHLLGNSHAKKDDIAYEMTKMNILRDHELYCKDCGKKFSGIVPLSDHLRSSSHMRQLKKNQLWKNLEDKHPEVLDCLKFGIHGEGVKSDGNLKSDCETSPLEFKTKDVQDHFTRIPHQEVAKQEDQKKSFVAGNAARLSENDDSSDDPLIEL